jgi:inorganic pyrophosphatase
MPVDIPTSEVEGVVNVVVESPAGSTGKIKWEPRLGAFVLARPLPLGMSYPHDWGFVAGTRAPDGDPLDVLVLAEATTFPGLVLPARPIGLLRLKQNRRQGGGRERNDRVIAVPAKAARQDLSDISGLPPRLREELEQFFLNAVFFESKAPTLLGWGGRDEAWALVQEVAIRSPAAPGAKP